MGGWPAGYLQSMEELNSGPPKTNPSSSREQDLNQRRPDYKSSTLTTRPRCLKGEFACVLCLHNSLTHVVSSMIPRLGKRTPFLDQGNGIWPTEKFKSQIPLGLPVGEGGFWKFKFADTLPDCHLLLEDQVDQLFPVEKRSKLKMSVTSKTINVCIPIQEPRDITIMEIQQLLHGTICDLTDPPILKSEEIYLF